MRDTSTTTARPAFALSLPLYTLATDVHPISMMRRPPQPSRRCPLSSRTLTALLVLSCFAPAAAAAAAADKKPLEPCTIRSPSSNAFFNLNPISKHPPTEKELERHKDDEEPFVARSWHARGHDYGANFTINFCAPVVEDLRDVEGVEERMWANVSAYYEKRGLTYSIGQMNAEPVFRGRKLVLKYTDGSPCPGSSPSFDRRRRGVDVRGQLAEPSDKDLLRHETEEIGRSGNAKAFDDEDEDWHDYPDAGNSTSHDGIRRKSTIFSMLCERDPLAAKAAISFVGEMDECTYFFEVRSLAACAGVEAANQSLGPSGVFGVIAMIAVLVYIVGGCVYQRTVMHQRGWRQLPNYNLWAGIGGAFKDCVIVVTSSCARVVPRRRGYSRVSGGGGGGYGYGRRRGLSSNDDENRLIDQLDEEWDD